MAENKTEKPTPRKLREAAKKGQVARSRNLSHAFSLGAVLATLLWAGGPALHRLLDLLRDGLRRIGHAPVTDIDPGEVTRLAIASGGWIALIVGPIALAAAFGSVATFAAQGGIRFAPGALAFNLGRLNPVQNLKRLSPAHAGPELLKAVLGAAVVTAIAWPIVTALTADVPRLSRAAPLVTVVAGWDEMLRLLKRAVIAFIAIGAADYGVQRWRHLSALKMTKPEVKEDLKASEGNPEIKARVRRVQREMVRRRMLAAIPHATVIVTNPTHYAVALEYRRGMGAPRVVAKGRGFLALKIKEVGREHNVPMMENVPLAQALYKGVDLGESIPAALFEAVAEVLAYLIRLKQLVL
jgi:flagellar biosynthetic protein FlhB